MFAACPDRALKNNGENNCDFSFENACYRQEVYFLEHKTKIEYLPAILRTGQILPRSQQKNANRFMGGAPDLAYFAPYIAVAETKKTLEKLSSGGGGDLPTQDTDGKFRFLTSGKKAPYLTDCALFIFELSMLKEHDDYYANKSIINHGIKDAESFLPAAILDVNQTPIKQCGEICFPKSVAFKPYLVEIWIHPSKENIIKEFIQHNQIDSSWQNYFVYYESHPNMKLQFERRYSLTLFQQTHAVNEGHSNPPHASILDKYSIANGR